jgi:AraC-like DNA-binding protein
LSAALIPETDRDSARWDQVAARLTTDLDSRLSMPDLAADLGMEYDQFRRSFRQRFGRAHQRVYDVLPNLGARHQRRQFMAVEAVFGDHFVDEAGVFGADVGCGGGSPHTARHQCRGEEDYERLNLHQ